MALALLVDDATGGDLIILSYMFVSDDWIISRKHRMNIKICGRHKGELGALSLSALLSVDALRRITAPSSPWHTNTSQKY